MLRKDYNIQPKKNGKFGTACVYLEEPSKRSAVCATGDLSCSGYGSSVTVTAAMGLAAASWCIERIVAAAGGTLRLFKPARGGISRTERHRQQHRQQRERMAQLPATPAW
jgi:hypothetical protein